MRIAVNTRFLLKDKLEGIGLFTAENLKRISRAHPEHEFIFIFDRPFAPEFIFSSNVEPVVAYPQARHPFLYYLYFQYTIPYLLHKHKADFFLSPDGYLSLRSPVKQLQVIHDLAFEHYPQDISRTGAWYYRHYFPRFAREAVRIATVSEYSKSDIIKHYGIEAHKIDVVYNGASQLFKPLAVNEVVEARKKYTAGCPYFIAIGAMQPRKNLHGLFKAFDQFKSAQPSQVKLLVVGRKAWKTAAIEEAYNEMKHQEDVIFTGRVSDEELARLLGASLALTYVSFFEGFGIPILEAMQSGVPVICSGNSSMPEVGGKAVMYVDPLSTESISSAMQKIASHEEQRQQMTRAGLQQAAQFSWEKTSSALWQCLERALSL